MSTENINKDDAKKVLNKSFVNKTEISDDVTKRILSILTNTHKTYKYILVNGLLAKSTNDSCNPIALQAGAEIEGAFDARSLCHSVLVPFEREKLRNALGGSNEPFLNKPARFQTLSTSNAVRRGNDMNILADLIYVFENVSNSDKAFKYLTYSLSTLKEIADEIEELNSIKVEVNPTYAEIIKFIDLLLTKSMEGEIPVLIISTIETLVYEMIGENFRVVPHKVNQSGSSSKEIGDIDVYNDEEFIYSIEVKDKNFTEHDIEHAVKKIVENGGAKFQFIYGLNATYNQTNVISFLNKYSEQNNILMSLISIKGYIHSNLLRIEMDDSSVIVEKIMQVAVEINCKEDTKKWIKEAIKTMGWQSG